MSDPRLANPEAAATEEDSHKRAALAGQWRTPPLPVFGNKPNATTVVAATATGATANSAIFPPVPDVAIAQLPDSTEDYAKALQEAYRRGAEAAAAMAGMTSAVSCPDLKKQPPTGNNNAVATSPTSFSNVPNPLPAAHSLSVANHTNTISSDMGHSTQFQLIHPGHDSNTTTPPSRAMSLPDMTTYAAQQEEEKRQKRLARNRASARLRRLRKKNLVDAYEQEVGILEKTLEQLKAHQWGTSDDAGALAEALSMDRGQQVLDLAERRKEAAALLEQQLEWVNMLEDIMMEDYVLHQIADGNPEVQELAASLQLSSEQLRQVEESKAGWQDEWDSLQTVKGSLVAMQQNEWLWNENVGAISEQFMSILHKNQINKFLLWADANSEAIDELDGVHASQGVPSGPVFSFGVESQPEALHDEEK